MLVQCGAAHDGGAVWCCLPLWRAMLVQCGAAPDGGGHAGVVKERKSVCACVCGFYGMVAFSAFYPPSLFHINYTH